MPQAKSKTVLVVDDDLTLQNILTDKLHEHQLNVIVVSTGAEALQSAATDHPDLILLDIMLKGNLNGFDVLEELKREEALSHIPVIVLTNLEGEQKSALNVGAIDYIVKPNISIDDVVLKIKNVLD